MQLKVGEECCSTNLQSHNITVLQNYNIYYEYINKYITIYIYYKYILKGRGNAAARKCSPTIYPTVSYQAMIV